MEGRNMLDCTISCFVEVENAKNKAEEAEDKKDTVNKVNGFLTERSCIWMFPTFTNIIGIITPAIPKKLLQPELGLGRNQIKHDLIEAMIIRVRNLLRGLITGLHHPFKKHKFAHN